MALNRCSAATRPWRRANTCRRPTRCAVQARLPDLAAGLADLPQNPLPASIEVRLQPGRADAEALEAFARQLTQAAGVADVRFDRRWLERLGQIASGVRWAGWLLGRASCSWRPC